MTQESRKAKGDGRTRREILKAGAAGAVGTAALSAGFPSIVRAADTVRIGYVSPKTGPLAPFAEADEFNVASVLEAIGGQVESAGGSLDVEIIVKDSQSNPEPRRRGRERADPLRRGAPALRRQHAGDHQPGGRPGGDQRGPLRHDALSMAALFLRPRRQSGGGLPVDLPLLLGTGRRDRGLPQPLGEARDQQGGRRALPQRRRRQRLGSIPSWASPSRLRAAGYTLIDPGRYQNLSDDFSAQISEFKDNDVELVTGVVLPPDFTTFWTQSAQQGFRPKAATVGKALLFPVSVEAHWAMPGTISAPRSGGVRRTPFTSSITGQSCGELAAAFTAATGKQWSQPVGYGHSIFEVALDVVSRAEDINDTQSMLASIVSHQRLDDRGPGLVGLGPGEERGEDAAGRRPVAAHAGRPLRLRPHRHLQRDGAGRPPRRRHGS